MELTPARLDDGALRFATPRCTFVVSRLGPGALHVGIQGVDEGESTSVLGELDREVDRFALPLRLWVDTRRASPPSDAARDAWTDWFGRRRRHLGSVHVLVPGAVLELTGRLMRRLSGTESVFHVSADTATFERGLEDLADGAATRLGRDRTGDEPVRIERTATAGTVRLTDGACSYRYQKLSPALLQLVIEGRDSGRLGALPLDELQVQQQGQVRTGMLFVDASGAGSVDARVRDEWVAWIRAHRDDFGAMSILAGSRLMQLTFGLAREAAQAGQRMRIHDDRAAFEADRQRQLGG